jgi:hypothetical protein
LVFSVAEGTVPRTYRVCQTIINSVKCGHKWGLVEFRAKKAWVFNVGFWVLGKDVWGK